MKDVTRRAGKLGLTVVPPPTHPFNPLLALRAASVNMDDRCRVRFTRALLDAVWMQGQDASDPGVIEKIADSVGLDGKNIIVECSTNEVKSLLRANTDQAIKLGVFGVPTCMVGSEIFWGSETDTLKQIEDALQGVDFLDKSAIEKWKALKPSASRR